MSCCSSGLVKTDSRGPRSGVGRRDLEDQATSGRIGSQIQVSVFQLALEIIDDAERIEAFFPTIQRLAPHSFVTREEVQTMRFEHRFTCPT